jgi:Xaa-Pro aminopeptidase
MNVRYNTIDPFLFVNNRVKLSKLLKNNSLAIFHSNDQMPRNGDCFFPFRQNSDFFYLSGIDQEQSILLLFPNCPKSILPGSIICSRNLSTNQGLGRP